MTPNDIYLLLKASDFITHDLNHAFDNCIDNKTPLEWSQLELVLKKWIEFNPSMEFRAFVRNRSIIAISQRSSAYFDFLLPIRSLLLCLISSFFTTVLQNPESTFSLDNFVFDVYIPKPQTENPKVWLVDINPFSPTTDSLLFSWQELLHLSPTSDPELRLATAEDGIHSFSTKPFSESMVPSDVVDASIKGGVGIAEFAKKWKEMLQKQESGVEADDVGNDADDEM